jgi:5'-3' exonuclease
MGIPWYFYSIYKKYNTEKDLTIDETCINDLGIKYLFLDYNSMIHPCAQQLLQTITDKNITTDELEEKIIESCLIYTRYIVNVVKPEYLYIMIDGVAPRAKINQQRERRFKSHFFKSLPSKDKEKRNESTDKDEEDVKINWNSNKITPGTTFMEKLTKSLIEFKSELIEKCYLKDVVISDSDESGEGEHKMMKVITNIKTDGKICIYGLDADLLMLSLINKCYDKIILIRDNTFNSKLSESDRVYTYVDISRLRSYICKDLRIELSSEITNDNLIYDYIFLCFLLGNDFLEHIPSLKIKEGGINVLLKYYTLISNTKGYNCLINIDSLLLGNFKDSINLNFLQDLFYYLSKTEEYFYKNIYSVYKNPDKKHYRDVYDIDLNYSDVHFYNQDIIKYNKPGYKQRYYKFYGIQDKDLACEQYLRGLYWILGYYQNHNHNNWSWYYPNYAVPFASDIFSYLLKGNQKNMDFKYLEPSRPLTTREQLIMVLPKHSLMEIMYTRDIKFYKKLYRLFNTKSKQLQDYYPEEIYLDMIHKEYLWQSKIFLKTFNNEIINILV